MLKLDQMQSQVLEFQQSGNLWGSAEFDHGSQSAALVFRDIGNLFLNFGLKICASKACWVSLVFILSCGNESVVGSLLFFNQLFVFQQCQCHPAAG